MMKKFLLTGENFLPELHLKQPEFTYSASGPFTKHKYKHTITFLIKKISVKEISVKEQLAEELH